MKSIEKIFQDDSLKFEGMDETFFLIGLLSTFENHYQATADKFFQEISWKQFFVIICIDLFEENPSIKQLAEVMGSSHQNVKQILNKLQHKGFIQFIPDEKDKRMQRIILTEKTRIFCEQGDEDSKKIVGKIFEGIASDNIKATINTIIQMIKNLEEVEEIIR